MRRARFQLSAWKSHHPSSARVLSRIANFRGGTRDAAISAASLDALQPEPHTDQTRENQRRRGAFSRGRLGSVDGVAGECPSHVQRHQPRSASGLTCRSGGRQLRAGWRPMCSQDRTSSVPRRRALQPNRDYGPQHQARATTGRAIPRIPPDRHSRWLVGLAQHRPGRGRPPLPGAACKAHFPCLCVWSSVGRSWC